MADKLDMGLVAEGHLYFEGGDYFVRGEKDGKPYEWSLSAALEHYVGEDVRVVIVSFDTINKVAKMVEEGGLTLEDAMVGKLPGVE